MADIGSMAVKCTLFLPAMKNWLANTILPVFSHIDTHCDTLTTFRFSPYNKPTRYLAGTLLMLIWVDAREILTFGLLFCVPELVVRKSASSRILRG